MLAHFRSRRSEDGASAVEYGMLVAGIAGMILVVVFLMGGAIKGVFDSTCSQVKNSGSSVAGSCT